ncbi:hypothetical protein THOG11_70043 [Vibrio harveyi]|nr:hypothetical protein TH15OA1_460042 [Vibrio harveyi]CAH1576625.1 hypothetical protein THOD03_60043 [Vibrio harveyi]CAH1585682.1 hypothetical protein THOG11_70043 [Vibrio harveyi]
MKSTDRVYNKPKHRMTFEDYTDFTQAFPSVIYLQRLVSERCLSSLQSLVQQRCFNPLIQ